MKVYTVFHWVNPPHWWSYHWYALGVTAGGQTLSVRAHSENAVIRKARRELRRLLGHDGDQ